MKTETSTIAGNPPDDKANVSGSNGNLSRNEIEAELIKKRKAIEYLQQEIIDLRRKAVLLSDETQWFTEKMETLGRGKKKRETLVGRIHWNEGFKDEDSGEIITVQRTRIVRFDGEWQ